MSVAWPSVVTNVNTPALSIVKTTRPECKVVDGPEGMSLGNRMITELPKSSIRNDPSELGKMRCSLPFDLVDSVEPVLRLVNVSADPVPVAWMRTTLPFLSINDSALI